MTSAAAAVIDVRELADPESAEMVLGAFDALAPGESLVVVGVRAPRGLLQRLQADRKGTFEWSPLEQGPARYRTQLTRRSAERGARREVAEALAWDHDRLDALERRAFELLAAEDRGGAQLAWIDFEAGLRRHIRFEEELLFPAFEAALGLTPAAGPTAVMRAEHREIERLLEAIDGALARAGDALRLRSELQTLLGGHNVKEEGVLYPKTDELLAPEKADALVARIQES